MISFGVYLIYMAMNARHNLQGSDIGPVVHCLNSRTYCTHWVSSKQLVHQYSAGTSTSSLMLQAAGHAIEVEENADNGVTMSSISRQYGSYMEDDKRASGDTHGSLFTSTGISRQRTAVRQISRALSFLHHNLQPVNSSLVGRMTIAQ